MEFFQLKVKQTTQETSEAISIEFDIPADLLDKFQYKQGQFITLRSVLEGLELRRSYSMSSSPVENKLVITVKKVEDGVVSGWLNDQVKTGDTIEVSTPDGRFYNDLDPDKRRTYYMFGAGSGITPLKSIIQTILEKEPMSAIFLLYGSRSEDQIIFRDELDRMTERYAGQLHVEYVLSQPKKEGGGLFGIFKKSSQNWQGKSGRINGRLVNNFLDEQMARGPEHDCYYFICGPGSMTDDVKATLVTRGVSAKQIHTEHFVNANHIPGEFASSPSAKKSAEKMAIIHLNGERLEIPIPDGATILDVLVKEKYDPPYSCTAGACSTCMAKLTSGKVNMEACYALDDDEVKAGYILTCQSHLVTDVVELTYDM
ncbi:MAG: ferredoxin--NADP reductase [Saprospiraceae bacterium]